MTFMPVPAPLVLLAVFFVSVFFCSFFSVAETALNSMRRSHLESAARSGNANAEKALNMVTEPGRLLIPVRMTTDFLFLFLGFFGAFSLYPEAAAFIRDLIESGAVSSFKEIPFIFIILILITVAIAVFFVMIFGRLVPERIALSDPEKVTMAIARPIYRYSGLLSPVTITFSFIADRIAALLGFREKVTIKATEEDVKAIVQEGFEDGEIEETEQDLVERVFSFADRNVSSVLTHKCDIAWLDADMTKEEVYDYVRQNLYSIYPVAEESLDNVIGVVTLKDLINAVPAEVFSGAGTDPEEKSGSVSGSVKKSGSVSGSGKKSGSVSDSGKKSGSVPDSVKKSGSVPDSVKKSGSVPAGSDTFLRKLARPANVLPENFSILETLESFRDTHFEYALITDEFGSVQGIVTLSDLLNVFVGDTPLDPETDSDETAYEIRKDENGFLIVDGQYPFYDLLSHLDASALYNDSPYNTLSGLILDIMDTIPKQGDVVTWNGFSFEILEMDRVRIDKVRITVPETDSGQDDPEKKEKQA